MQRCDDAFYELVQRDPLFAAEGMDLERAEAAINELERELRKFHRAIAPQSLKLRLFLMLYPLTRTAVPIAFLRSFVESERCRRIFLVHPTRNEAARLVRSWKRAARAMHKGVQRYDRLHRLILLREPDLTKKKFQDMAGNSFTMQDVARSLQDLRENAEVLLREAYGRSISGGSADPRPRRPAPVEVPNAPLSELDRLMEELEEERLSEWFVLRERLGPISYELPHFDGKPTAHQFVLHIAENRTTHEPYFSLFLADYFVFLPIGKGSDLGRVGTIPFQPLIDRGIRFFYQSLTMFYTTRDQRFVFDLLTIFDRKRRPTLDQGLLASQRSSLFDLALWRTVEDLRRYTGMTLLRTRTKRDRNYSIGHAFLMQSHPSVFFLPFNWSVWRLDRPAHFLGNGRVEPHQNIYKPLSFVAPLVSRTELRDCALSGVIRWREWEKQGVDRYS